MPLPTPSSTPAPDPNDPYDPVEPDRPFTRLELTAARFANVCAETGAAFRGFVAAAAAVDRRIVADRIAEKAKARARFERARRWVRDHPDAL